jgi:hypothetical protein
MGGGPGVLSTEVMSARHGLVSGLLGRRTRSLGRGGRRGGASLVLPFGGMVEEGCEGGGYCWVEGWWLLRGHGGAASGWVLMHIECLRNLGSGLTASNHLEGTKRL